MSALTQVEYIPQAKIASLFVVFGLVIVCKWRKILHYSLLVIHHADYHEDLAVIDLLQVELKNYEKF